MAKRQTRKLVEEEMEKKRYEEPRVEVIELPDVDIITTSGGIQTGSDTETEGSGNILASAKSPLGGARWQ